jgi:hypothetical protein
MVTPDSIAARADRTRAFECAHRRRLHSNDYNFAQAVAGTKSHVFAFVVDVNSQI